LSIASTSTRNPTTDDLPDTPNKHRSAREHQPAARAARVALGSSDIAAAGDAFVA
jgi:hypothetical protein